MWALTWENHLTSLSEIENCPPCQGRGTAANQTAHSDTHPRVCGDLNKDVRASEGLGYRNTNTDCCCAMLENTEICIDWQSDDWDTTGDKPGGKTLARGNNLLKQTQILKEIHIGRNTNTNILRVTSFWDHMISLNVEWCLLEVVISSAREAMSLSA